MTASRLADQLLHLADTIERPREEDGTPATLEALLPCEPAVGEVAVACWSDSGGGELIELVRLDDGTRLADHVALREALTLLAMVETVEELASFEELAPLARSLAEWRPEHPPSEALDAARDRARAALEALATLAPGDAPRIARPRMLDELGAALRELEHAWQHLEQAATIWSDELLEAHAGDADATEQVQSLWRVLAVARRGPLQRSPGEALHAGREAGAAMASAVTDAAAGS